MTQAPSRRRIRLRRAVAAPHGMPGAAVLVIALAIGVSSTPSAQQLRGTSGAAGPGSAVMGPAPAGPTSLAWEPASWTGPDRGRGHEVGVRFTVAATSQVWAATFYDPRSFGHDQISLWDARGTLLGRSSLVTVRRAGWHRVRLAKPVAVRAGGTYVVSFWSDSRGALRGPAASIAVPRAGGVQVRRVLARDGAGFPGRTVRGVRAAVLPNVRIVPAPRPAPPASRQPGTPVSGTPSAPVPDSIPSSFPNASNTGVPARTSLTPYTGSCSIWKDLVITAKVVNCDMMVYSGHLTIRSSRVNGIVINDTEAGSLDIVDSEINGGTTGRNVVGSYAVTVLRSNIHGGQHSVQCWGRCTVQDSWLHGQYVPPGGTWHLNAFISNGGSNMKLIHNTLSCDAHITSNDGGCTADASIFGDFDPNTNFTFDRNLFVASTELSYCAYGGYGNGKPYGTQVSGIVFTNNTFQRGTNGKCGLYGPVTSFNADLPGAVWRNNVWDDGTPLPAP